MTRNHENGPLRVSGVCKSFGKVRALAGASLELRNGELLGLLGPNGAGKTTLVRGITGRVALDAGEVTLCGERIDGRSPPELGLVPQEIAIYPELTARENLEVFGRLNGLAGGLLRERVDWALDWTGLADRSRHVLKTFSGGMKRRVNIACGVLHRPRVILLDEPTVGVDPQSRERIYEMLELLRSEGASILLTTHHLDEAERRCDRIVIIDQGRDIATGTLDELVAQTIGRQRRVAIQLDQPMAEPPAGVELDGSGDRLTAHVDSVARELPPLLEKVAAAGRTIVDVQVLGPSLHSVFIHLTGRELRE